MFVNNGVDNLKRFGHASCVWDNKLIIIGGSRMFSKESMKRECLSDGYMFYPREEEWIQMKWKGHFSPRRNHTAVIVGKNIVIHGGIDTLGKFLDDIMAIQLSSKGNINKWNQVVVEGKDPGYLAYHTCQTVLSSCRFQNSEQIGLYSLPNTYNYRSKVRK